MVGPFLTYEIEKKQYGQVLERAKDIDRIGLYYGAEHLLRMIVRLPKISDDIQFKESSHLKAYLEMLAAFLHENQEKYFTAEYFKVNTNQKTLEWK